MVRLARYIFCRQIIINKPELLKEKGPLLLACSHPNSFLDAILMDILFEETIWSLTRGDAFINKPVSALLYRLKMLPVYRPSEGVENLEKNYNTFDACIELFRNNGVVLIFSEGLCVNEWHLRKLKKGTARLSIRCQDEGIPLKIIPVGINYSSFRRFGKNVFINFGNPFTMDSFNKNESEGNRLQAFNAHLYSELKPLVYEIDKADKEKQKQLLAITPSATKQILFFLPSVAGWLLHAPLYIPVKKIVLKKLKHTVHVDSVTLALLFFLYPVYLTAITLILYYITGSAWTFSFFILFPFTAWCHVRLKRQLDKS